MHVFGMGYCLAPEHSFPAALDDSTRIGERAREAGVDIPLEVWKFVPCLPSGRVPA